MKIGIQGIGVSGGFGNGKESLLRALGKGRSKPSTFSLETSDGAVETEAFIADTSELKQMVPPRKLRRLEHYTRIAVLGALLCLDDIPEKYRETIKDRMGIIVATGFGATCNTFEFHRSLLSGDDESGSPVKFANSVHNAAASHISIMLGASGPNLSVSHFDMSFPSAFLTARQWLMEGRVESVLVGAVDEYCKVLGYYRHCALKNESGKEEVTDVCEPAIIGEGGAFFFLSRCDEDDPQYGVVKDMFLERRIPEPSFFSKNELLIINADGYNGVDGEYSHYFQDTCLRPASFTGIYGGIPIGQAFDVAIAALCIENGTWFASVPGCKNNRVFTESNSSRKSLEGKDICCMKFGSEKLNSVIRLGALKKNENV